MSIYAQGYAIAPDSPAFACHCNRTCTGAVGGVRDAGACCSRDNAEEIAMISEGAGPLRHKGRPLLLGRLHPTVFRLWRVASILAYTARRLHTFVCSWVGHFPDRTKSAASCGVRIGLLLP